MLLIDTFKSGTNLCSDKGNDTLSFEIWIFHNGQSDCDDHRGTVYNNELNVLLVENSVTKHTVLSRS
jgi:hypothetical protein